MTQKPLIVKLTPNVADPASIARAAEEGGADAVSLINTLKATAIDTSDPRPLAWGGSAAACRDPRSDHVALEQVRAVAGAVSVPVIGMGGIESGADALVVSGRRSHRRRGRDRQLPRSARGVAHPGRARDSPGGGRSWFDLGPSGPDGAFDLNLRSKRISSDSPRPPLHAANAGI